ncbi:MAG: metalloprotease TldD [Myxococcota bacterium]
MSEPIHAAQSFFHDRFGLDDRSLTRALDTALERQVDYADLYFEYTVLDSVALEEGIVKSGSSHLQQGVGVRAQIGERQGYAYSDDVTVKSLEAAASTARAISQSGGETNAVAVRGQSEPAHDLYPVALAPTEVPVETKVDLLGKIDTYARAADSRVKQVMASVVTQHQNVLIAGSDGTLSADTRPLVRLNVQIVADDASGRKEIGYQAMGGRYEFRRLLEDTTWQSVVDEAVRVAMVSLEAVECPAGAMPVVLGPGWPGILLHEAIGHGLEGDFNRKKTSAFTDRIGERVASDGVTVVDDGTLPERRGSINVDDEGTPTQRTTLIENGILTGYLQDRLNARLMNSCSTGNGRRESYAHLPMPRMTNTFMLAGDDDPDDIIRSVPSGIYAVSFGGGQVDITSGKFVFSVSEAYKIENGRVGAPLKGATLIGNGPDILTRVSRIGNDLKLDPGVGTCGKDGQSVPVGVGLPTIRLDEVTVGGTGA